ncbi:hypothetical protein [Streptomyces graminilatus]|uniref:hypothetical protein n=1 Tax=Streptomyces graminilatus TaxID=1464070 RepID=UPI0018E3E693|nr:hypothetical protein [Streptomyces graminilatus]
MSILPVDQGIEHSAASAFAANPRCLAPKNIAGLALDGGCNAVASTLGVLGAASRRYAHRIPFIVKLNHNELLTHPSQFLIFRERTSVRRQWMISRARLNLGQLPECTRGRRRQKVQHVASAE